MVARSAGRRCVWLVDDSPVDLDRARRILASQYDVKAFPDAASVLERLSAGGTPDLIVLDWIMPGLSGIELCRFLRSAPGRFERLPVLMMTASREETDLATAFEAGANDFVSKPFSELEFQARVSGLVRTSDLMRDIDRANAMVQDLLAKAPDALLAVSVDDVVIFANEEAALVFDATPAELVGRAARELLPEVTAEAARGVQTEESRIVPDVEIGGRVFAPTVRELAREGGFTVSLRDVTENRRAQTKQLDFYSIVAHDLRSPLSAMLLRCEMMQRGKYGFVAPAILGEVKKIELSLRQQVAMINDFLDIARLEHAGIKLEREELRLEEIIGSTVEELRPLAEASQIALTFRGPAGVVVSADRRRLCQVVANLLANAIKFTGAGGRVDIVVDADDRFATTLVTDNGPGIPEEAQATLFERYTRGDQSRANVPGTGLGLMIVRQVVEAHGGKVWVKSTVGQGSTFGFRLPCLATGFLLVAGSSA